MESREIRELTLIADNEKDFNRSFSKLLKSKNLKVKEVRAIEKIVKRNREFPFNCKETIAETNKIYLISDNSIVELSIVKTYVDDMPQSFDIDTIKIKGL